MKKYLEPIYFNNLKLNNRVFYAPLAGCSDYPFRQMSAKYRPGLMYAEMVKMEALIRLDPQTLHMLDYSPEMYPIGAQICGSNPNVAAKAAKILEQMGFATIDLNCGCPVDKITKDGSGSAMLKTPQLIGEVLSSMKAAVKIPVTVKIRAGWHDGEINAPEIVKIAEKAGAASICVHARTREQAYRGSANWQYIKECKQVANNIKVVGNGDVVDGPSALKMLEETGCDAVLVARATMGQPWIVEEILSFFEGKEVSEKTVEEARAILLQHYYEMAKYHNDHRICVDMRRVGCWYLKKAPGTRKFREIISRVSDPGEIEEFIKTFPLS